MSDIVTMISSLFRAFFVGTPAGTDTAAVPSIISQIASTIVETPILLVFVALPLVGLGIGLFKRLIRTRG